MSGVEIRSLGRYSISLKAVIVVQRGGKLDTNLVFCVQNPLIYFDSMGSQYTCQKANCVQLRIHMINWMDADMKECDKVGNDTILWSNMAYFVV